LHWLSLVAAATGVALLLLSRGHYSIGQLILIFNILIFNIILVSSPDINNPGFLILIAYSGICTLLI
jgi:hypothetical protein